MIIEISKGERYPDYSFSECFDDWGRKAEVPDERVAEWKRVIADYERVQNEIGRAYKALP